MSTNKGTAVVCKDCASAQKIGAVCAIIKDLDKIMRVVYPGHGFSVKTREEFIQTQEPSIQTQESCARES